MKRSKEGSSPNFLIFKVKVGACCSSRDTISVGQNSSSNPENPGYEILPSVNLARKKYKLQMLFCSANLVCTHKCEECTQHQNMDIGKPRVTNGSDNSGDLSIGDACLGKPRVCAKDLSPQAMLIPDAKATVENK